MKKNSLLFLFLFALNFISNAQNFISHERIYLVTGEYEPQFNWDALLRLDTTENFNSLPDTLLYDPEGTIPFKECIIKDSVKLNFGHGLYYQESKDRMFIATIFTNQGNYYTKSTDTSVGAIAIFDSVSMANGAIVPTRYIFGPSTQLLQPHGCWVDEKRDMLYVANTFGKNILVFHHASTINGDVSPDRIITHDSLGCPLYIFIDSITDRMFACTMPEMGSIIPPKIHSQIAIYSDSVSYLNDSIEPDIRITGDNTRLELINKTTHNCWFNPNKNILAVGHHTYELLFFDMDTIDWNTSTPIKYDLTPRVIRVDNPPVGTDSSKVSLYGMYWDIQTDRMFCSIGYTSPSIEKSPPEAIRIYNNVSDTSVHGSVAADRIIYWSNGQDYYPPQPIWLQKYSVPVVTSVADDATEKKVNIYTNSINHKLTIEFYATESLYKLKINDLLGRNLFTSSISTDINTFCKSEYDLSSFHNAILVISLGSETSLVSKKILNLLDK
jgi:hypothetical protein